MKHNTKALFLGAALVFIPLISAEAQNHFEWRGAVDPGDWVEIRNVVGHVNVEPASGSEVEITAVKSGRSGDFDLVDIVLEETRNGVTVCALYPERRGRRRGRSGDRDRAREDGNGDSCRRAGRDMDVDDVDVDVDFEVRLPAGVNIRGTTVAGDVDIRDVDGEAEAVSVSGDLFVSTSGFAEATTVSGSIEVHLGRTDWTGELKFQTVSGDVRVYVPDDLNADVSFHSVSGDMESDFPIRIRRRSGFMAGSLRGTIGEGGRDIEINTVSGDAMLLIER